MAGFVRIRQVESRPNLSFGRTLRLSSDRHDLIPPPLAVSLNENKHSIFCQFICFLIKKLLFLQKLFEWKKNSILIF